jgi:hypothetical protein
MSMNRLLAIAKLIDYLTYEIIIELPNGFRAKSDILQDTVVRDEVLQALESFFDAPTEYTISNLLATCISKELITFMDDNGRDFKYWVMDYIHETPIGIPESKKLEDLVEKIQYTRGIVVMANKIDELIQDAGFRQDLEDALAE